MTSDTFFRMYSHSYQHSHCLIRMNESLTMWSSSKPHIQSGTSNDTIWSEVDEENDIKIRNHKRKGDSIWLSYFVLTPMWQKDNVKN